MSCQGIWVLFCMKLAVEFPPLIFKKIICLFLERGREGEKERNQRERNHIRDISCLSQGPQLGTPPATQACALTGN